MIELTPRAQSRLDEYLAEIRRVLAGSATVNAGEVEQDVRDHIQSALSGQSAPVEEAALDAELRKLGPPGEWLPDAELPWFRRPPSAWLHQFRESAVQVGQRLAGGPESYRMAYLSLAVLASGMLIAVIVGREEGLLVALIASATAFIFSRASLSLLGAERLTSAQKWLLYPALLLFYIPLLVGTFVVVPSVAGVALYENAQSSRAVRQHVFERQMETQDLLMAQLEAGGKPISVELRESRARAAASLETLRNPLELWGRPLTPPFVFRGWVAITGLWLGLVALVTLFFPGIVHGVFYPFGGGYRWRHGLLLLVIGVFLAGGGLAAIFSESSGSAIPASASM